MFHRLRKRLTFANVTMTLALIFAMSGGAYAASKYVITSTKQIKPNVLAQLKGAAGKTGSAGANGAQGSAGPTGPAGSAGKEGPAGKEGKEGQAGKEGPAGKEGKTGATGQTGFTATLPKGATETGTYATYVYVAPAISTGKIEYASISFAIPLGEPPASAHVHFVTEAQVTGHTAPSECQGTAAEPKAGEGSFCVYEGASSGLSLRGPGIFLPYGHNAVGVGSDGAILQFLTKEEGEVYSYGAWAVTAE